MHLLYREQSPETCEQDVRQQWELYPNKLFDLEERTSA